MTRTTDRVQDAATRGDWRESAVARENQRENADQHPRAAQRSRLRQSLGARPGTDRRRGRRTRPRFTPLSRAAGGYRPRPRPTRRPGGRTSPTRPGVPRRADVPVDRAARLRGSRAPLERHRSGAHRILIPGGKTASSRRFVERLPGAPEWPSKPSGASGTVACSRSSGPHARPPVRAPRSRPPLCGGAQRKSRRQPLRRAIPPHSPVLLASTSHRDVTRGGAHSYAAAARRTRAFLYGPAGVRTKRYRRAIGSPFVSEPGSCRGIRLGNTPP